MFKLEIAIAGWKQELRRSPAFEDGDIAELESHLREEIEQLRVEGIPDEEAFKTSMANIGQSNLISSELRKVQNRTSATGSYGDQASFWQPSIWMHYLRINLRNQLRHSGYSLLNIAGLAIGLAACLLIARYVQFESSFDRYHNNADRIYRLVDDFAKVPGAAGPALKQELPEIQNMVRLQQIGEILFTAGDRRFYVEDGFYADSTLFNIFSFELLEGQSSTALSAPGNLVISRSLADRLFGEGTPALGRSVVIDFDDRTDYTVTGVMGDIPAHSHFQTPYFISQASDPGERQFDWYFSQFYTYLLLGENDPAAGLESSVEFVIGNHTDTERSDPTTYRLQALPDIHLHSNLEREIEANGNILYLYTFGSMGLVIFILTGINFINLSTARSLYRAGEVGVRKAAGATRFQLIRQFIGETVVTSYLAMAIAVALAYLLQPLFNEMTGQYLEVGLFVDPVFIAITLLAPLLLGILAGSYPAFVQASFNPVKALIGSVTKSRSRLNLRKSLVAFQFVLTSFMILATVGIFQQISYMQNKNLGFDEEQLIVIPIRSPDLRTSADAVKQRLVSFDHITGVSVSGNLPDGSDWGIPVKPEGLSDDEIPSVRILAVDHDFTETYGMTLAAGRNFDEDRPTDMNAYLINREAAAQFGWEKPLGKMIAMPAVGKPEGPVIGVIENFHFRSLHETIGPVVMMIPPANEWFAYYTVKVEAGYLQETIQFLEDAWSELDAAHPFGYSFFDENIGRQYEAEQRAGKLTAALSILSIAIAAFGLIGLVSFSVQRRTKEIGIRKILGASQPAIAGMLSGEFIRLTALGFLIAAPLGYLAVTRWMENFAYHTGTGIGLFLITGLTVFAVTLSVLAYHTIRAATMNPVKSLRNE